MIEPPKPCNNGPRLYYILNFGCFLHLHVVFRWW